MLDLKKCDSCMACGERYYFGTTARYCPYYDEYCHDLCGCFVKAFEEGNEDGTPYTPLQKIFYSESFKNECNS